MIPAGVTMRTMGAVEVGATGSERTLLERTPQLASLQGYLTEAAAGRGRLVLVSGEAGVGKTALVRRFCGEASATVLWGACDPLSTPRPLGPLVESPTKPAEPCNTR